MPDQDEFAPLARRWIPVHEMIILDKTPHEIADAAFRTLREMLRECGGCPLLSELVTYLEEFSAAKALRPSQCWTFGGDAERELAAKLDRRARDLGNRRIDAVAVRSCRIAAIEIAYGQFPIEIGPAFATLVAKHLLCHFVLDRARSLSHGMYAEDHVRQVHSQVLANLEPYLERFGRRWLKEPDARFTMRARLEALEGTTAILGHEEDFSLD